MACELSGYVMLEEERFHSIDTPLLAIYSYPSAPAPSQTSDPAKVAACRAAETTRQAAQFAIFQRAAPRKGDRNSHATHDILLSCKEEVISQISDLGGAVSFMGGKRLGLNPLVPTGK